MDIEQQNHIYRLSDPVLLEILKHLDAKDLLGVCCVSKRFYRVSTDESLWSSFSGCPFPIASDTPFSLGQPHKAKALRAIKIDNNFRQSMKPIDNKRIVPCVHNEDEFECMDESLLVTRSEKNDCFYVYSCNGDLIHELADIDHGPRGAEITRINGNKCLVSFSRKHLGLRVWCLKEGILLRTIHTHQWRPSQHPFQEFVEFAVNSNILIYGSNAHVVVWDLETGDLLHALAGEKFHCAAAIDETRIAAALYDFPLAMQTSLKIWSRQSGELQHSIDVPAETREIDSIILSGQFVICNEAEFHHSGHRVWDTVTGQWSPLTNGFLDVTDYNNMYNDCGIVLDPNGGVLQMLDMQGQLVKNTPLGPDGTELVAVFDNGFAVIQRTDSRTINLVDINRGEFVRSIEVPQPGREIALGGLHIINTLMVVETWVKDAQGVGQYKIVLLDFGSPLL